MLFKNTMRPAFAAAGANGSDTFSRSKAREGIAFSEGHSAADDFGSFGTSSSYEAPKRPTSSTNSYRPQSTRTKRSGGPNIPVKGILVAVAAIVAIVLLILVFVALFSAPKNGIEYKDNAYFVYSDSEGKYHVVANGKTIKQTFDGKVTLSVSKDCSFTYVFEEFTSDDGASEIRAYVIDGTSFKDIGVRADQIMQLSDYEPGIIYKKGSRLFFYSSTEQSTPPITSDSSADNFVISGDASTVVYTIDSSRTPGATELKYFRKGGSQTVGPNNFIPVALSHDGKFVYGYGTSEAGLNTLHYLEVKKDGESAERTTITTGSYGSFVGITGMNSDGNEIVFYTETEKGPVSYMYKIGSEPVQIAEGSFTPISSDRDIACPDTFVNGYFICTKDVMDADGITSSRTMTYKLDKNDGALKIANTTGVFSPDEKYFYYIDEYSSLVRVALNSKDFEQDAKPVMNEVTDFEVIESGDIYVMLPDENVGFLYFWDASTTKRQVISYDADLDSMQLAANSVYFSETKDGVTTIYVSTSGSTKEVATFKDVDLTSTPIMTMGVGEKGYAFFTDEAGNTRIYYTSNGKKFTLIVGTSIVDGQTVKPTEAPTEAPEEDEEDY